MSLQPARHNFTLWKGATFDKRLTLYSDAGINPWNLSGYTGELLIKDQAGGSMLLDLTTVGGGLILGGPAGTIDIIISAAQTTAATWTQGVYDLIITSGAGEADILLYGSFTIRTPV